jgi:hypothetical protein
VRSGDAARGENDVGNHALSAKKQLADSVKLSFYIDASLFTYYNSSIWEHSKLCMTT